MQTKPTNPLGPSWIVPNWPAPKSVQALTTLRTGGVSLKPYDSFNLANHVGDNEEAVLQNRLLLKETAHLPQNPLWLMQVHGIEVIRVEDFNSASFLLHPTVSDPAIPPTADATITEKPDHLAAVLTADCLPILLCNKEGTEVAAIHAGWRGIAKGVIESTVSRLKSDRKNLMAWFGPAIGPNAFEVGEEMRSSFLLPQDEQAFIPLTSFQLTSVQPGKKEPSSPSSEQSGLSGPKWKANIYQLARFRLEALDITQIYGGEYCTFSEPERFFSFRRSGDTGRMATIIWIKD